MTKEDKRIWGVAFGGWLATVLAISVGVWQFNRGEQNKVRLENELLLRKDEIAFQRQLWLERLATYRKIAEVAGAIVATVTDKKKMEDNILEFTTLYWGIMIFVQDKDVEQAMIDFNVEIKDYQNGWSSIEKLKYKANSLIQACRQSAEKGSREALVR
jgi:hypothetical protein